MSGKFSLYQLNEFIYNNITQYFCSAFSLGLIAFEIFATWYDFYVADSETSPSSDYLLIFSLRRNFNSFASVKYTHRGLDSIHFLRLFFMVVLVAGPTFAIFYYNPVINSLNYEKVTLWDPQIMTFYTFHYYTIACLHQFFSTVNLDKMN